MSYRNISLSLEAYETLKKLQKADESFSKEILRLAKTARVSDVIGILSEKEAAAIKRGVETVRIEAKVKAWH